MLHVSKGLGGKTASKNFYTLNTSTLTQINLTKNYWKPCDDCDWPPNRIWEPFHLAPWLFGGKKSCFCRNFFFFFFFGSTFHVTWYKRPKESKKDFWCVSRSGLEQSEFALIILNINLRPPIQSVEGSVECGGKNLIICYLCRQ